MIKIIKGIPYRISTILIIIASTLPPKKPAIAPQRTPITRATMVAKKPTINEILLPYNILVRRSLPKVSVPSKWSVVGPTGPKLRSW